LEELEDLAIKPPETAKAIAPASHKKPFTVALSPPPVNARIERTNQIIATIQQSEFEYLAKPVPCVSMSSSQKNIIVIKVD
jgi:hypothetical protein